MPGLQTCLWFDGRAEEAADFYVATFRACGRPAARGVTARWGEVGTMPVGAVLVAEFELDGHRFMALNGGPQFTFSPAVSMVVRCADQTEIDRFWDALLDGGAPQQCGWLTDRFGLSWQVIPEAISGLISDPDPVRRGRVMEAVMGMVKLDLAALQRAYDGTV